MSDPILLNVLLLDPFKLIMVEIDPTHPPFRANHAIARAFRLDVADFSSFVAADLAIKLPTRSTKEKDVRRILPVKLEAPLAKLPRKWDASALFSAEDDLHLVVIPNGSMCVTVYDKFNRIVLDQYETEFYRPIKNLIPKGRDLAVTRVFKAPWDPNQGVQDLDALDLSTLQCFPLMQPFDEVFPWGLPLGEIIIIDSPVTAEPEDEHRDLPDAANLLYRLRLGYFKAHPPKSPSSEGHKPQKDGLALFGRPHENLLPPSLLDETLCSLRHDVDHIAPDATDFRDFYALREAMVQVYKDEYHRQKALIEILAKFMPQRPAPGTIGTYTNDGQMRVDVLGMAMLYYMQKLKNEMAGISTEPYAELIRCYIEHCRDYLLLYKLRGCNFPIILICQVGSHLLISVAVFTTKPVVEQIACLPLHAHTTNTSQVEAGARAVASLRKACLSLKERYPMLIHGADVDNSIHYPFKTSFEQAGSTLTFKFESHIPDKRVFRARLDGKSVYVKYSLRYGQAVHEAAHRLGFAPKVLGFESFSGWVLVVMEDLSRDGFVSFDVARGTWANEDLKACQNTLVQHLGKLHEGSYVHGDIRDINVLVRQRDLKVMVVDWDWAGMAGTATYPMALNLEVPRPDEAIPGGLMECEHDVEMVKFMMKQ